MRGKKARTGGSLPRLMVRDSSNSLGAIRIAS